MSQTTSAAPAVPRADLARRRVRHQVRDAALLMAFSAGLALAGATGLLVVTTLVAGR
ncbi:hypothetical protein K8Z61_02420 [Nocardioides sp. TRM66260-LWL]|uniref:hypothetical protein n=1 Tax=Nocardioides sp. TRM66260-LWL TaxID=2874478 RepID=UPI001CC3EB96|nr:hypothetical protein [Nocardioides sp. TRM66260-LWL]MBZ5733340.1 hypothetical protein [Nocardioides sp. TRM66260-LWL]